LRGAQPDAGGAGGAGGAVAVVEPEAARLGRGDSQPGYGAGGIAGGLGGPRQRLRDGRGGGGGGGVRAARGLERGVGTAAREAERLGWQTPLRRRGRPVKAEGPRP